jgi:hypothetical protein
MYLDPGFTSLAIQGFFALLAAALTLFAPARRAIRITCDAARRLAGKVRK